MITLTLLFGAFFLMWLSNEMEEETGILTAMLRITGFGMFSGALMVAHDLALNSSDYVLSPVVLDRLMVMSGLLVFLYVILLIFALIREIQSKIAEAFETRHF